MDRLGVLTGRVQQLMQRVPALYRVARRLVWRVKYLRGSYRLKRLPKTGPLRIVIGASGICDPGWIETDIQYLDLLNPEHWEAYFRKSSIDALLAEHVWEHLTIDQGLAAARQCFEVLKPGGYLRVAVPDGFHADQGYVDCVRPGGTGAGSDDHKVLYDQVTFAQLFEKAGFRVELLEHFDAEGNFHYVDWSPEDGRIIRSRRFDERNRDGELRYTSLILDAHKDR